MTECDNPKSLQGGWLTVRAGFLRIPADFVTYVSLVISLSLSESPFPYLEKESKDTPITEVLLVIDKAIDEKGFIK